MYNKKRNKEENNTADSVNGVRKSAMRNVKVNNNKTKRNEKFLNDLVEHLKKGAGEMNDNRERRLSVATAVVPPGSGETSTRKHQRNKGIVSTADNIWTVTCGNYSSYCNSSTSSGGNSCTTVANTITNNSNSSNNSSSTNASRKDQSRFTTKPRMSKDTARKSTTAVKKTPPPKTPEDDQNSAASSSSSSSSSANNNNNNNNNNNEESKDVDSTTDNKSNHVDGEDPPELETEPELELELSVSSPMSFGSVNPDTNPDVNPDINDVSNQSSVVNKTQENPVDGTREIAKPNGTTRSKKGENIPKRRGTRQLTRVREMDRELAGWINGYYTNDRLDELTRDMITDRAREIAKEKNILDFAGTTNWFTRFLGRNFSDASVSKQLKMLSFANPGKFMEDFDPERSAREMRKMNRRIYRENVKKNQMYDEAGRLLDNSKDVCDCLDEDCPGCHFPCRKCGSEKCGTECRCNRKWVYEMVEIEGTNLVINNPSLTIV